MAYKSKTMQRLAGEIQPESADNYEYKSKTMQRVAAKMAKEAQQSQLEKPVATQNTAPVVPDVSTENKANKKNTTSLKDEITAKKHEIAAVYDDKGNSAERKKRIEQLEKEKAILERRANVGLYDDDLSMWERIDLTAKSVGDRTLLSPAVIAQTTAQAAKDFSRNVKYEEYRDVRKQQMAVDNLIAQLERKADVGVLDKAGWAQLGKLKEEKEQLDGIITKKYTTPMNTNSETFDRMAKAQQYGAKATEGLTDRQKFFYDVGTSIAENASLLPLNAALPGASLAVMGAKSGADKMYEVAESGGSAAKALAQGVTSGAIEIATEKMPLDNLLKILKGPTGKSIIKTIGKQAGEEFTEEGIAYILNFIADAAYENPNAQFSLNELLQSALAGGISGGIMGAGGVAINKAAGKFAQQNSNSQNAAENVQNETQIPQNETQVPQNAAQTQQNTEILGLPESATRPVLYSDIDGLKTDSQLNTAETEAFTDILPIDREFDNLEMVNKVLAAANKANKNPVTVAENNFKAAETALQPYLEQTIAEYEDFSGEGVSINTETGERMSNNPQWYRDYYAKNKKAPSKADKRAIAEKMFWEDVEKGGGNYIPPEIAQRYNAFKGVSEQLKGLPLDTMYADNNNAITSKEGIKPVYSPVQSKQMLVDTAKFAAENRYGAEGKTALSLINNATEGKMSEFDRYYRAGIMNQKRPSDNTVLTKNEATSAYMAGIADAKANKEAYGNKNVIVHKNAGLDENTIPKELFKRDRVILDKLGKAFGVQISFAEIGDKNGYYDMENGTIVLNTKTVNENSKYKVFCSHELVHRMRQTAPNEFYVLADEIFNVFSADKSFAQQFEKYAQAYELDKGSIEYYDLMEEMVADFIGNTENTDSLVEIVSKKPTLAEKFIEVLRGFLEKLNLVKEKEAQDVKLSLEQLLEKTVKASEKAVADGKFTGNDAGNINEQKTDYKYSRNIDKYGNNSYTDSKWIKDNNIVSDREYEDFVSKVMSIKSGTYFEKTSNGLYMIPTGNEFGVNNTIIFTDGNVNNPSVEKVVHINLDNETDIEKVRDVIYAKETNKWAPESDIAGDVYGEKNFKEYSKGDFHNIYSSSGRRKRGARTENSGYNQQQRNGRRNYTEGTGTLKGYRGESLKNYDKKFDVPQITLDDGDSYFITKTKGKWNSLTGNADSYDTLKEAVEAANKEIKSRRKNVRYSLNVVDSDGNKVSDQQSKYFENSKVRDKDGNLLVMYHGTTWDFTVFTKEKGNPENDMGIGYYFSNQKTDSAKNYSSVEGADLSNRIERLAEQIESEEEIDRDDAYEKALKELYGGEDKVMECYLNITNPVVIKENGGTYLESYSEYDEENDEYGEVEGELSELLQNVVDVCYDYDIYDVDNVAAEVQGLLYDAYIDGAYASDIVKKLKSILVYSEDDNGQLVGNEIIREAFERSGFDGIIDYTVSGKFKNMGLDSKTMHAIAFSSNQIKNINNVTPTDSPDIRYSNKDIEPFIPEGYKERGLNKSLRRKSDFLEKIKQVFIDEPEIYKQLSNKTTEKNADAIFAKGVSEAEAEFDKKLDQMDAAAIPLGKKLADEYIKQGQREHAVEILRKMAEKLTKAGQFSQATVIILTKDDPVTALMYAERDIDKLNADGRKTFGKKWKEFKLTDNEKDMFKDIPKGDEQAIKDAYKKINDRIAKEYPVTLWQKFVEASRISMLLNPRTNARNIVSNALLRPLTRLSGVTSAAMQNAYTFFDKEYKPTQVAWVKKDTKKLAEQIWDGVKDTLETANKYNEGAKIGKNDVVVFKEGIGTRVMENIAPGTLHKLNNRMGKQDVGVLETMRNATYWLLEAGDQRYVRKNFLDRLGSYLQAQGITELTEQNQETVDAAVQVAYREALRATFKDDTALSSLMASIKHTNSPVINSMMEMIVPFTKTPANIAMRGIDYSPVGFLNTLNKISKGASVSEICDELGKNTVGSLLIMVGAWLFSKGFVSGGEPDDKDKAAFMKQQGWLPYAVKVGNNYVTYDWAQPAAIPVIMGVTIAESLEEGRLGIVDAGKNAGIASFNQWIELSPLQSLKDVMGGNGSVGENMLNTAIEMPQRLIPSALGATARVADRTQRVTYSKGDTIKTQLDIAKSKLPGVSKTLPVAYDTWGKEKQRDNSTIGAMVSQYLNPSNTKSYNTSKIDDEINRLFDVLGDKGVFPQKAAYSITKSSKTYNLSNAEYSEYQRIMGELSYDGVKALMGNTWYSSLTDDEKAEIIKDIYGYAGEKSKYKILEGQGYKISDDEFKNMQETKIKKVYIDANAENVAEYYLARYIFNNAESDKGKNGKTIPGSKKKNGINRLVELGFTRSRAKKLYEAMH